MGAGATCSVAAGAGGDAEGLLTERTAIGFGRCTGAAAGPDAAPVTPESLLETATGSGAVGIGWSDEAGALGTAIDAEGTDESRGGKADAEAGALGTAGHANQPTVAASAKVAPP